MGVARQERMGLTRRLVGLLALAGLLSGCQTGRPMSTHRLLQHAAYVDFGGLKKPEVVSSVNVACAAPEHWTVVPAKTTPLYIHQQWKSPSTHTGFGVAYIHMPLPFGPKMLVWLAKQEYAKKSDDGKVLREWEDDFGRDWFEAENNSYHVRGYAVTHGFEAWIVYYGYKSKYPPEPAEISLAARASETIIPQVDGRPLIPTTQPTVASAK